MERMFPSEKQYTCKNFFLSTQSAPHSELIFCLAYLFIPNIFTPLFSTRLTINNAVWCKWNIPACKSNSSQLSPNPWLFLVILSAFFADVVMVSGLDAFKRELDSQTWAEPCGIRPIQARLLYLIVARYPRVHTGQKDTCIWLPHWWHLSKMVASWVQPSIPGMLR